MSVVNLEEFVVADLLQFLARDRPAVIRMVDMRNAALCANRSDAAIQYVDNGRASLRRDRAAHVKAVDMQRLGAEPIGELFAFDHEESFVGAVQGIEAFHRRDEVVIGQH
jgi:hypothetical protein